MNKEYHQLQGIFLIILTIVASTTEGTFSKQVLHLLKTNLFAKHILIIFLIYFTIDYSDHIDEHPLVALKRAFMIWILYIIVSRQNVYSGTIIFLLLALLYVKHNHHEYLKHNNKKRMVEVEGDIDLIKKTIGIVAIVGFIFYFRKQYKSKKNFSMLHFLLR